MSAALLGSRNNLQLVPNPTAPSTQILLVGPARIVLGSALSWNPGPGSVVANQDSVEVNNFGQGGRGSVPHCTIDITQGGVSTETLVGGIDPGDPLGPTCVPNTNYHVYVVATPDPTKVPNDWGLVLSSSPEVFSQGPSPLVQASYPYWAAVMWAPSNAAGNGFAFMMAKTNYKWCFAGPGGCPRVVAAYPASLPRWTGVSLAGFGSPNCGLFDFQLTAQQSGALLAIAPNPSFGTTPVGQAAYNAGGVTFVRVDDVQPDEGLLGVELQGVSYLELVGGTDAV